MTRIRYLISYHHTPQKLRQIKNNLKKKIYDHFNDNVSSSKKQTFEAEQYFNPPVILLGNKKDVLDERRQIPRKVAKAKGELVIFERKPSCNKNRQAQELECGFDEISCMDSPHDDIRQVFANLYRGIRAQEKRAKINSSIKLAQVEEFSDPRKHPHRFGEDN